MLCFLDPRCQLASVILGGRFGNTLRFDYKECVFVACEHVRSIVREANDLEAEFFKRIRNRDFELRSLSIDQSLSRLFELQLVMLGREERLE